MAIFKYTISDYAILSYKVDNYFAPEYDSGINVHIPVSKLILILVV